MVNGASAAACLLDELYRVTNKHHAIPRHTDNVQYLFKDILFHGLKWLLHYVYMKNGQKLSASEIHYHKKKKKKNADSLSICLLIISYDVYTL